MKNAFIFTSGILLFLAGNSIDTAPWWVLLLMVAPAPWALLMLYRDNNRK
jgi:hypothetical protein